MLATVLSTHTCAEAAGAGGVQEGAPVQVSRWMSIGGSCAVSIFVQKEPNSDEPRPTGWAGCWASVMAMLTFWRPSSKVLPATSKRTLKQSMRQSVLLCWAFVAWGMMIIICYAIGFSKLATISGPIATFNMVRAGATSACAVWSQHRQGPVFALTGCLCGHHAFFSSHHLLLLLLVLAQLRHAELEGAIEFMAWLLLRRSTL